MMDNHEMFYLRTNLNEISFPYIINKFLVLTKHYGTPKYSKLLGVIKGRNLDRWKNYYKNLWMAAYIRMNLGIDIIKNEKKRRQ